jgi:hypothetical protein
MPNRSGKRDLKIPAILNLRCVWCSAVFSVILEGSKRSVSYLAHPPATCSSRCAGRLATWRNSRKAARVR